MHQRMKRPRLERTVAGGCGRPVGILGGKWDVVGSIHDIMSMGECSFNQIMIGRVLF